VQGRTTPTLLPTTINAPRPRVNTDDARHPESSSRQQNPMRGLDAYERALWNWVNVYSLDEFLQEVYYYYEGKGIYSIALARGLNLLLVP
jgi:autophagy-related protein 9